MNNGCLKRCISGQGRLVVIKERLHKGNREVPVLDNPPKQPGMIHAKNFLLTFHHEPFVFFHHTHNECVIFRQLIADNNLTQIVKQAGS
jgi:hypothetical protein